MSEDAVSILFFLKKETNHDKLELYQKYIFQNLNANFVGYIILKLYCVRRIKNLYNEIDNPFTKYDLIFIAHNSTSPVVFYCRSKMQIF